MDKFWTIFLSMIVAFAVSILAIGYFAKADRMNGLGLVLMISVCLLWYMTGRQVGFYSK
jgi:uncharacterized membrane protein